MLIADSSWGLTVFRKKMTKYAMISKVTFDFSSLILNFILKNIII